MSLLAAVGRVALVRCSPISGRHSAAVAVAAQRSLSFAAAARTPTPTALSGVLLSNTTIDGITASGSNSSSTCLLRHDSFAQSYRRRMYAGGKPLGPDYPWERFARSGDPTTVKGRKAKPIPDTAINVIAHEEQLLQEENEAHIRRPPTQQQQQQHSRNTSTANDSENANANAEAENLEKLRLAHREMLNLIARHTDADSSRQIDELDDFLASIDHPTRGKTLVSESPDASDTSSFGSYMFHQDEDDSDMDESPEAGSGSGGNNRQFKPPISGNELPEDDPTALEFDEDDVVDDELDQNHANAVLADKAAAAFLKKHNIQYPGVHLDDQSVYPSDSEAREVMSSLFEMPSLDDNILGEDHRGKYAPVDVLDSLKNAPPLVNAISHFGNEAIREDLIHRYILRIGQHTKVSAGIRVRTSSALILVGNGNGTVGIGYGKGDNVLEAIHKSLVDSLRQLVTIDISNGSISHETQVKYKSARIWLAPAAQGTGLRCAPLLQQIMAAAGITDIVGKIIGRRNVLNVSRASLLALQQTILPETLAKATGKNIFDLHRIYRFANTKRKWQRWLH